MQPRTVLEKINVRFWLCFRSFAFSTARAIEETVYKQMRKKENGKDVQTTQTNAINVK